MRVGGREEAEWWDKGILSKFELTNW
jgi:hypothetical protein